MMKIGKRLKDARELKGFTLEEVREMTGISFQSIWKYENDEVKNIPSENIEKLAKTYGVHPAYIMGWVDDPDGPVDKTEEQILLEELHKNPSLRILLSASKDVSAESLNALIQLAKNLKGDKE